ncbi:MAG TPA: hypothetical protein VGQ71_08330 [Terriglobales bacterium]|jgi:hypothetical protein|nr:hypothetical protein [Terriglobales bacterium]
MPDTKPTHAEAQLQLQLYDLRREAKLRLARDWFTQNYFVDNLEDSNRIAPPLSQEGTYVMMVLGYWDQACALLNHGLLHEQLFFESSGEFFAVWERAKPVVPAIREKYRMNHFLVNLEKAAERFENWVEKQSPGSIEMMRQYTQQMRSGKAQQAA